SEMRMSRSLIWAHSSTSGTRNHLLDVAVRFGRLGRRRRPQPMDMIDTPAFWVSLTALTFLEIVLGVDNLLFVSIAIGNLKGRQQDAARRFGVWGAMVLRILMLSGIFWIIQLEDAPLFRLPSDWAGIIGVTDHAEDFLAFTIKDLILLAGGLFLLVKGT